MKKIAIRKQGPVRLTSAASFYSSCIAVTS
jgi:hypothetical protein